MARTAEILVDVCSYAGTGNVLKVQQMLHICAEHAQKPKKKAETSSTETQAEGANGQLADADVNMDTSDSAPAAATDSESPDSAPAPESAEAAAAAASADAEEDDGEPAKPLKHQAAAVIGIALIAMGEEVGAEMALRQFQHLVSCTSVMRLVC